MIRFREPSLTQCSAAAELWVVRPPEARMADACLVCFRVGRCDLDGAARALAGLKLSVERSRGELGVRYPGGPVLRVVYDAGGSVAEENAEIAQMHPPAAALLPCDARF